MKTHIKIEGADFSCYFLLFLSFLHVRIIACFQMNFVSWRDETWQEFLDI